ncbi:hypothetical protein [Nocardia sp. NPDC050412]|uniref:hypothetical protein n=1 Tax=Nocardia sp. NPDC050412 TaxID=3364320 RepID=UPI00379E18E9
MNQGAARPALWARDTRSVRFIVTARLVRYGTWACVALGIALSMRGIVGVTVSGLEIANFTGSTRAHSASVRACRSPATGYRRSAIRFASAS